MTGDWAIFCRRVASGEVYSTNVVIVVILGILSSCLLVVLVFVRVFGPLSSGAMRVHPLYAEAAMRSGM